MKYAEILFFRLFNYCLPKYILPAIFFLKNTPYSLKKLDLTEFLDLQIISEGKIHWHFRDRHLDLVTDNGQFKKIGKIVDYLSSELSKKKYLNSIIETLTDTTFKLPDYPRRKFWRLGNNFFIYNVIYGFRRNVIPYKEVYKYILNELKPYAFTKEYYLSLYPMEEQEIAPLLRNNSINSTRECSPKRKSWSICIDGSIINIQSYIPLYILQSNLKQ